MRNLVFLSHANPEDNSITLWLALQLTRHGYDVWCDLTKLLGGETFWRDIELAIRQRTAKFLYVLSRTSNQKTGPLNELQVALNTARDHKLDDFVIPLHIDDLPHREIDIRLSQINAVEFSTGWAGGLSALLKRLEDHGVSRDPAIGAHTVASWWRKHRGGEDVYLHRPEMALSNWFPVRGLPETLYLHHGASIPASDGWRFKHPCHGVGEVTVSFATADELSLNVRETVPLRLKTVMHDDKARLPIERRELTHAVQRLLRDGWQRFVAARGLPTYALANDRIAAYFPAEFNSGKMYSFTLNKRIRGRRVLSGMWRGHHWHYGISADMQLFPDRVLVVKSHVLFSEDGATILDSKKRLHSYRRSACKGWWNDDWRDRLLGAMHWLAAGSPWMEIPLSPTTGVRVRVLPTLFRTPLTYWDRTATQPAPELDDFDDLVDEAAEIDGDDSSQEGA